MTNQEKIDEIMDNFDFEKVYTCMLALDWKWSRSGSTFTPDVSELKKAARKLLYGIVESSETARSASGGFSVLQNRESGYLSLTFEVTAWETWDEA